AASASWGAPAAANNKRTALRTVRLDQVVARLLEMLADERLRLLRVALVEGIEDAAVLPVILGDHLGHQNLLSHRVPLRVQAHVIDLTIHIDEQRIAGGMRDQEREFAVPFGE